jgi:hypothetical protein
MKRRLCIGIQKITPAWDALLNNLGVSFEQIDYKKTLVGNYSTIVLNSQPNSEQTQLLASYLSDSGSVLEIAGNLIFTDKDNISSLSAKTLIGNTEYPGFEHIPFLDVFSNIQVYNNSELFDGLIHFKSHIAGSVAFFGVDVADLIQQSGYSRKRFYSTFGEHPDEIVSKISKHQLLQSFLSVLKESHYRQGLPFVTKWTSPSSKPVFGFRIDSDFGDQTSIDNLYSVLKKHDISATWFLHVKAHQNWLEHFQSFDKQEIALHGYHHGTSKSKSKTYSNIQTGKECLQQAGFNFDGFCAPYGIWNEALKKSLSDDSFSYTSEFTFAYDGYPIQPVDGDLPLQIPIHPICTGSLSRKRYSPDEMKKYFKQVFDQKLGRFEPIFFYHHPLQTGLDVMDDIFEMVKEHDLHNMTFSDFARFWKSRDQFLFEAWFQNDEIQIEKISENDLLLNISMDHNSFDLLESNNIKFDLSKTPNFKYSNFYLPEPQQVHELRKRDLRLLKTSLLDWKNRIRL